MVRRLSCAVGLLVLLGGCRSASPAMDDAARFAELFRDATACPRPLQRSLPTFTGVIAAVDGDEATIELLGMFSPWVGASFAIFDESGYHGEAVMVRWSGDRAVRCKLHPKEPVLLHKPIAVGMAAATNLGEDIRWLEGSVVAVDDDCVEIAPAQPASRGGWILGDFVVDTGGAAAPVAIAEVDGFQDRDGERIRARWRAPNAAVRVGMRAWTLMTSRLEERLDFDLSASVPSLCGVVRSVEGRAVTIVITDNPIGAPVRPGYSFSLHDAHGYHGEAKVVAVGADGAVRCNLTPYGTEPIAPGMLAATKLAADGR